MRIFIFISLFTVSDNVAVGIAVFIHFVLMATKIDALKRGIITEILGQNKDIQTVHMCAIVDNEFKRASVAML